MHSNLTLAANLTVIWLPRKVVRAKNDNNGRLFRDLELPSIKGQLRFKPREWLTGYQVLQRPNTLKSLQNWQIELYLLLVLEMVMGKAPELALELALVLVLAQAQVLVWLLLVVASRC